VNRRFIRSSYLNHAVANAYQDLLASDSFPLYVIFLEIDPSRIDINVHPTKQEIKFDDERIIYAFVNAAVRRALSMYAITPTLDFERETAFDNLVSFSMTATHTSANQVLNLPSEKSGTEIKSPAGKELIAFDTLLKDLASGIHAEKKPGHVEFGEIEKEFQSSPYQLHQRYILSPIKSGFILIDQQAAHERIVYERFQSTAQQSGSQNQLFTTPVHISPADIPVFDELLPVLTGLGFSIEKFGGSSYVLHGIPADLHSGEGQQLMEEILEDFKNSKPDAEVSRHKLLLAMARRASIKAGTALTETEMRSLIDQLFGCQAPYHAPDGRPTIVTFEMAELEKLFS
jgi:DNA mismatch repair protein MutL